jgi:hypothetical protein
MLWLTLWKPSLFRSLFHILTIGSTCCRYCLTGVGYAAVELHLLYSLKCPSKPKQNDFRFIRLKSLTMTGYHRRLNSLAATTTILPDPTMSKVPISIESLLQKQKEEREAASKVSLVPIPDPLRINRMTDGAYIFVPYELTR